MTDDVPTGGVVGRWARLAATFFLVGLAASRISLVLHELVGHGAVAELLGGDVVAYRLFVLGGGWVRYLWGSEHGPIASIAVSLGGVTLEIAAALAALAAAGRRCVRSRPIAEVALVGFAAADLVHAGAYLAAGVHYGFGDGRLLHDLLGPWRVLVVVPAAGLAFVAGFVLSRRLARLVGGWAGTRSRGASAVVLISAAAVAALVHAALAVGERQWVHDETYSQIMRPDREVRVEEELARRAASAYAQGIPLDERAQASIRAQLEEREREFPLTPLLAGGLALACAVGVWRGLRARPPGRAPGWLALRPLAAVTAASIALVAVLRLFE